MIQLPQGLKIGSTEAVDSRFVLSQNEMYQADDLQMPDHYFAIGKEDNLLYVYVKAHEKVLPRGRFVLANDILDIRIDGESIVEDPAGGLDYLHKRVADIHIPIDVSELVNDANYTSEGLVDEKDLAVKNWADDKFALIDEAALDIKLECTSEDYKLKAILYDKNGVKLSESNVIDLPIERLIENAYYDSAAKELVIIFTTGQTVRIPVSGIIQGLATEAYVQQKIADEDVAVKAWADGKFYSKEEVYSKAESYNRSETDLNITNAVAAEAVVRNNADEYLQNQISVRPTEADVINMLLAKQNKFDAGNGLTWNQLTSEGLSLDADNYITGVGINVTDVTKPGAKYKTYQLNADAVAPTWGKISDKPFDLLGAHLYTTVDSEGNKLLNVNIPDNIATQQYVDNKVNVGIGTRTTVAQVNDIVGLAVNPVEESLDEHKGDTVVHTNATEKAAWNAKYDKPTNGIPKVDLADSVKASLDKADTAIQSMTDYRTAANQDIIDATKVDKVEGYGLSKNDFSDERKNKLAGIAEGAQVNVLEGVKVDNVELAIEDKKVNISLAAKANLVNGKVPLEELPSFIIASVVEGYYDEAGNAFYEDEAKTIKITPETSKIYVDKPTSKSYKWLGSLETGRYVEIDNSNTYYSVSPNVNTMGELREYINSVNLAGLHCLFDLHGYTNEAYVCLIHMYSNGGTNYCDIFDMLNRRYYFNKLGYTDATLISAYIIDANKEEIITDISGKEDKSNKVVAWDEVLSDVKYPSEKLVKNAIDEKANLVHTHTKSQITDFPTIPVVNDGVLTVQKNGANVGTFSANASAATTINLELNKSDVGLANVENKSSETIRSEITKANITSKVDYNAALGGGLVKNGTSKDYTFGITKKSDVTLSAASWEPADSEGNYYKYQVNIDGVTGFSTPVLDVVIGPESYSAIDQINEAWSKVYCAQTFGQEATGGYIILYATESPTIDINIQVIGY